MEKPTDQPLGETDRRTGSFVRRTLLYAIGNGLARGIGFVLLPIYAHYLTPAEYGIVALAKVVGAIATIVLSFGLPGAVLKFHFSLAGDERRQMQGTLWGFLLGIGSFMLLATALWGDRLFGIVLREHHYAQLLELAMWAACLEVAFVALASEHLRAIGSAWGFLSLQSIRFFGGASLAVALVAVLNQGAMGAMRAHLGAIALTSIFGAMVLRKKAPLALHRASLSKALVFGLPLVPYFVGHWVLSASDRFLILRMSSLSDTGIYHVGYQIASVVQIFVLAGSSALLPVMGNFKEGDAVAGRQVARVTTLYLLSVTSMAVCVSTLGQDVIRILAGSQYVRANEIIPWICMGLLWTGLASPAIQIANLLMGNTRHLAIVTVFAALVNVGLNILLIPSQGIVGAAVATLISYLLMFLGFARIAMRGPRIPFEYGRVGVIVAAGSGAVFLLQYLPFQATWTGTLLRLLVSLGVCALLLAIGLSRRQHA